MLLQSGFAEPAAANPQGAVVMGGAAQIVQTTPSRLDINQSSNRAVIDWHSFSVGAGETTNFNQPSSSSLAVNRVTGANPSDIAGRITANGQIVLVNPNGIVFQRDSRIDAASFVATTSGISVGDAMAGRLAFTRPSTASTASIVNRGRITVKQGGLAALVAPGVANDGVIRARLGKAVLAAGETFTLDLAGDRLVNFAVDGKVLQRVTAPDGTPLSAAVANTGRILADGGIIEISVDAAKGVVDRAISMKGIAEAKSVHQHQGAIVLDGGEAGTVHLAGRLDASGNRPGEVGGRIAVTGANVALHGAALDASGAAGGGTIAVGGNAHGAGPLRNAARTRIDTTSVLRADAGSTGNGGSVTVWSEQHTRFNGAISARGGPGGGDGGAAEVSSRGVLDFHGTADLRAPSGTAGTLLLDPNDFVIQSDGTSTRPLIGTSVLTVADLQNELALGNVSLTTGPAAIGTQPGNITVANDIAWSSGTTLSLSAHHDIAVNAKISSSNAGSLVLRADNTGTGAGTITFGAGGAIHASGGAVSLYFNSNDNTNNQAINGQSFAATQSYAAQLTLSGGATATQYALVNTVFDLANINNNPAGSYALGRNIDASPIANFPMIAEFSGLFDGQNQTIDKLTINSAGDNVGLFAKTGGGSTVRNVGLTNLSLTATADNSNVGGLAGLPAGAIVNAYTTGSVTAPVGANAVGGLVGQTAQTGSGNGSVAQSSSSATVTGGTDTGGLVGGTNASNTISQSFATGAVSSPGANAKVGGLVGINSGTISDSYATGPVNGDTAGGLVGREQGNSVTLSQVYAAGPVTGNTTGGLVGQQSGPGTISNAYWDTGSTGQAEARGQGTPIAANGLTTAQLQDGTLPAGFDAAIWRAKQGSYPTLIGPPQSIGGTVFAGPGGLPLSGATVRLLVDGVDSGLTSTTTAGGSYSFSLPGDTIAKAGGEVLAVVTDGGSGNAFFEGATGSLANLDIYGGGFLTVYSGAASLSAAATRLHAASGGAAPPAGVAGSLLFSPTNTAALSLKSGAGLWLNPTAGAFSLDLPLDNSAAATVLISSTGLVGGASPLAANKLLLLGNGGNYTFSGGAVNTLAASTGGVAFIDDTVDLTTGTISGVAGVAASGTLTLLGTSGNLTLAAGAPVSGSGAGAAVILLAGGAFTNNAGAGAIQAGSGGRFLVYSQDPANDKRGGLAYDFKQYNATVATPVLGTGNGFLYSIAPTITLTGVTKAYDGTTVLPPGPAGIVSTGAIDNDAVTLPPATGSYDTKNAGSGKTVTLTGLALGTAIDSTGAAVFGYQLAPLSPANTIGTITPAALTIAAVPNTKTYDGTVASSATPTASGLVAGDTLTELAESFDSRNAGSRTLSVTGFAVGDGNGGNNYVVTTKTAAGTIDPAALTIAAAPSTRTYDGTTASSATPTVSGLVAGDTVSGLAQTFDSRNAGSRTLSIGGGFAVGDGNGGNNYVLTTKTAPGTISRARLTVTAAPNTKVFDGGVDAAALPTITTGALASGDSSVLSETYADPSVGTGKILTPTAAISDGNAGGNYAITLVASPTGVINAAPSLVVATAASRDLGQPNTPSGGTVSSPVGDEIEKTVEPPRTTTSQPATVIASIAQVQTAAQSIEQVQSAAQEIQKIATVNVLVPGRQDFVSRIVEGFDTKLKAPRQALFVVLPNEDGTVGAISVDDGKTVTLLDRPYAAAELRDGDTVAAEFGPDDAELIFGRGKTTRPKR